MDQKELIRQAGHNAYGQMNNLLDKAKADNAALASPGLSAALDSGAGRALAKAVGVRLRKVRKVPKATIRKRLVKALDKAFSLKVRAQWKACPFCGGRVEHCFHFVTRSKHSVRWDERNAVGSCAGCNYRYEFDPHFAVSWFIANRGLDAYSQLIRDGNQIAKHSNDELQRLLDGLDAQTGRWTEKIQFTE